MMHADEPSVEDPQPQAGSRAAPVDTHQTSAGKENVAHTSIEPSSNGRQAPPTLTGQKRKVQFDEQPVKVARTADQPSPGTALASHAEPLDTSAVPNGLVCSPGLAGIPHANGVVSRPSSAQPNGNLHSSGAHGHQQQSSHDQGANATTGAHPGQLGEGIAAGQGNDAGPSASGKAADDNVERVADDERTGQGQQVMAVAGTSKMCVCMLTATQACHAPSLM